MPKIWVKYKNANYNFINKLNRYYINYYDIKNINNDIYIRINEIDKEKLNKYLPDYILIKEEGIRNIINILKQKYIFLISIIIGIITFIILNNMIFKIEIIHENKEIINIINEELKNNNIKVLSFKKSYKELTKIKEDILNKYPDKLDWLEIESHGMKYTVRLEERIITKIKEEENFCNIYAKKDGIVTNYKITKGVANISNKDYVKVGDLLITGEVIYNEQIKNEVCASGEVYAERWYIVDISLPFEYSEYEETGKVRYNLIFRNENTDKRLLNLRLKTFKTEEYNIFDLFNQNLILEKEIETNKITKYYTEEEALKKCEELAEEKINIKISKKDEIKSKKVLKKNVNDSTMDIEIFIVTNELIN